MEVKSTHKAEIVKVYPRSHPNADRLEVVGVYGYSVCVGKGDFKDGDLGVYIPPDSIVPEIEQFKFVWESKGYAPAPHMPQDGVISDTLDKVPEKYRRIKAKKIRGVISEGLLLPLKEFTPIIGDRKYASMTSCSWAMWEEGDDLAKKIGITHYNPPELTGDCEAAPVRSRKKHGYPKTLKGWFYFLVHRILPGRSQEIQTEEVGTQIPIYDIDAWQRYKDLLIPGEDVWITEKIHGENVRFVWMPGKVAGDVLQEGRMYVGSHRQWKKQSPRSEFWNALEQNPWIESFCKDHPNYVLYGEVVPTQGKFRYGQQPNKYRVFAFDIFNLNTHKWLSRSHNMYLLDQLHWAPTVFLGPYNPDALRILASGSSLVPGANHIREGIVIRPVVERSNPRFGRVILKLKSVEFLEKS